MSSDESEQALLDEFHRWFDANNSHDVETIYEIEKDSIGYGYRTPDTRKKPSTEWKTLMSQFFSTMKEFSGLLDEEYAMVVGVTGFVWGWFTERIVEHDDSVRLVRVRFSSTWMKTEEGWKFLFYHRDNQFNR